MEELKSELIEGWALEREVVFLKTENKRLKDERDGLYEEIAELCEEITELQDELDELYTGKEWVVPPEAMVLLKTRNERLKDAILEGLEAATRMKAIEASNLDPPIDPNPTDPIPPPF